MTESMPFQQWPIHQPKLYEEFVNQIDQIKKQDIDVWLIGSDISQSAIQTTENNL